MKRSPLARSNKPMRRGRLKSKRDTPRRRDAPRWDREMWDAATVTLYARFRGICECCGDRCDVGQVERHHRQRRRDGGDRISNILMLRPGCHKHWTEHPAEAISRGIIVPTWKDPASVPVLWRGREWSMLDDHGSRLTMTDVPADWRITG